MNSSTPSGSNRPKALSLPMTMAIFFISLLLLALTKAHAEQVKAIGQIESLYRGRVSMRVLQIISPASSTCSLKIGDRVCFNLPKVSTRRDKTPIQYGNVIEVDLEGNVTTEYAQTASDTTPQEKGVMLWTAHRAERVRNPRKYLEPDYDDGTKKGRGHNRKQKKHKEPPQIWTQDEVVVGKVIVRDKRLYLKEDRLRPRDRGLDVLSDEWYEKLKEYEGHKVVAYGTTHRVSVSSGTIEIKNVLKIYPK